MILHGLDVLALDALALTGSASSRLSLWHVSWLALELVLWPVQSMQAGAI